jgi:integrase
MRQRGKGAWELRVYRGIDPETGRQRWLTKTVHGSRRHAQTQLATLVEEASHARIRAGTVGDLLERWFSAASAHWAPSTVRQTRSVVTHHLLPHLGHMAVTKLTTADIDDLYAHLLRVGGRNARRLSPGTVHRVHVVLHRALAQAVRWEWIWTNPASTATPPRLEPAEIRPPSADSVAALLESVRGTDPALFTYLRLAVCTGARRSQLLALRWDEVDLARGAIAFTRALVQGPDGPELRPTRTGGATESPWTLTPSPSWTSIGVASCNSRTLRTLRHRGSGSCSAVAPTESILGGRTWSPSDSSARRAAGLPQFRLLDLRHFMATQMLAAGVPIATVSQRLSHARASTTLNVYAHAVPGGDEEAAETLARILASGRRSVMPESRRRAIG